MKWILADKIDANKRNALKGYSDIEAQILFNKGIFSKADADKFFKPTVNAFHASSLLPNVDAAVKAIITAIENKQKIFIYGDYDVDGISATAIMFDYLFRHLEADVLPYIPNRFEEGYGLGKAGLDAIIEQGGKLVITVDCGIRDRELVAEYAAKGLVFIITDHHTISTNETGELIYPQEAAAVVHPGLDKSYPFQQICATTVAWKLVDYLNTKAKNLVKKEIDVSKYLDLVALATVCDIMPIIDENRAIVVAGIELIRQGKGNLGLLELCKLASVQPQDFDAYHYGFVIGPRLNAAGRIKHALDGVRLLTSNNLSQVEHLAGQLNELNTRRQNITETILRQALKAAGEQVERGEQLIFVYGESWSEGVVGLVASKINEKYYKPVLVANINTKEGIVKGSARSIPGFDVTAAITQSKDLLLKFGGHNQAAGFTLELANLQLFITNLQDLAKKNIDDDMSEIKLLLDAKLQAKDIREDLVKFLEQFQPFGYGNREPVFWFENLKVFGKPRLIGKDQKHLKFTVLTEFNLPVDVLGFNLASKIDIIAPNQLLDIAGSLNFNTWNGNRSLQIKLKDICVKTNAKSEVVG